MSNWEELAGWRGERLGPVELLDAIDSTNAEALRRVDAGLARDGLVLVARRQTGGHGSRGRAWLDVEGRSLAWSAQIAWPAALPPSLATWLGVVAVTDLLAAHGLPARVKWPNDALVQERKIAGVLAETRRSRGRDWVVLGIGLNVGHAPEDFPEGFATRPTSLAMSGIASTPAAAALELGAAVDSRWSAASRGRASELRDAFVDRLGLLGRRVAATLPEREARGELRALDLDGTLTLLDERSGAELRLAGGHVAALRAL